MPSMIARTRIIMATTALVRAHGFKAVRRRHIALNAKVAPATVNYHFDTMGALRAAIVEYAISERDVTIIAHAMAATISVVKAPERLKQDAYIVLKRIQRQCLA